MNDLRGQICVVTGGSGGIGAGVSVELAAAGATVYVVGRSAAVEEISSRCDIAGGTGIPALCDLACDADTEALFGRIRHSHGRIDVLVNAAASVPSSPQDYAAAFQPFWLSDPAAWDVWADIGLRSHYAAAVFAARMMVDRGRGLIVNVSSAAAENYFLSVAYGATKAALDRLTRDAAVQLGPFGVAVVSVWPGAVRTPKTLEYERAGLASLSDAESPELTGRAIVALATDSKILERSGRAEYTATLAADYGFTEDGSDELPPLPTYGGILTHAQPK